MDIDDETREKIHRSKPAPSMKMPSGGGKMIVLLAAVIIIALVLVNAAYVVDAGEVGVITTLGKVDSQEVYPGLHFKIPFVQKVVTFSTKTNQYTMSRSEGEGEVYGDDSNQTLTLEGLSVDVDMSVWYHIDPTQASDIYQNVEDGDYKNVLIRPTIKGTIRQVIARYEAKSIYSESRAVIQNEISAALVEKLEPKGIVVESILLRDIMLPDTLKNAIETKLQIEQQAEQMKFELEREELEAERKRVEAQGIADANTIISDSLTQEYLSWYWVGEIAGTGASVIYADVENGFPTFTDSVDKYYEQDLARTTTTPAPAEDETSGNSGE